MFISKYFFVCIEFSLLKENNLTDLPCAVVACYMDTLQPRIPGKILLFVFLC
jgi:hypothetical protein